jgi:hypothetical protein
LGLRDDVDAWTTQTLKCVPIATILIVVPGYHVNVAFKGCKLIPQSIVGRHVDRLRLVEHIAH